MLHLDKAHFDVDPLISKGIHYGVLTALTLVGSHYDSVDFEAIGQGYVSKKSDDDILDISNAVVHGAETLARMVSVTTICAQHQSPDA